MNFTGSLISYILYVYNSVEKAELFTLTAPPSSSPVVPRAGEYIVVNNHKFIVDNIGHTVDYHPGASGLKYTITVLVHPVA
ncbi:MAG: hypothetical protein JWQ98_2276 [Chlorobi bacterium]|nr:hypothetical protein [Chlorobiota bacterium]